MKQKTVRDPLGPATKHCNPVDILKVNIGAGPGRRQKTHQKRQSLSTSRFEILWNS